MKHVLSFVAFLFSTLAIAQTLPIAAPQESLMSFGPWVLAAAVIGFGIFWVRRHPTTVAKLEAQLLHKDEVHTAVVAALTPAAAVGSAPAVPASVLTTLVATNAQLATVVASAPVQAVVNAPAPAPAAQVAPPLPAAPTPTPNPAPSPYEGDGLVAVIEEVGNTSEMRNKAAAHLAASQRNPAEFFNATAQQDGTWNAAVGMVCNGIDPAVAYQNVSRPGQAPAGGMLFDEAKLLAAVPVIDSYR